MSSDAFTHRAYCSQPGALTAVADCDLFGHTRVDGGRLLETVCSGCACHKVVLHSDSTSVIAWYTCPECGCEWSVRLRGRHPAQIIVSRGGLDSLQETPP